ncbi:RIP metalloprotease RseP [Desulfurivibrio dismutans]|uniref:RIP metalloprotease RseP n=1 Tax=Desulfurivibrio dismutans TaxID=1398908 RepID=UPI0023DA6998|nr:RIP metalloprotease RseP [Desulfurivibrio alkaliphilus]MDF1614865.1 RIP metalloprotease RseP [Desulfurivibrio alkaliphilus]
MNTILSFIVVLGILIFVHEFGHFIVAKLFNVKVLKFSLGFGPRLFGRRIGETDYQVSALPLGGYVNMLGENPGETTDHDDTERSFSGKPLWQRFLIVAAGPFFNLGFAVLLFFLIYALVGLPQPVPGTKIGEVAPDSPAAEAGLLAGDRILTVNGMATEDWEDVSRLIRDSEGRPVTLDIHRNGDVLQVTSTPEQQEVKNIFGEVVGQRYMLGVTRSSEVEYRSISLFEALGAGFSQTWGLIWLTLVAIVKMIQQIIPATELGGPILIAQLAGQQMEVGWINFVYFIALISINLGILNLLPIPVLDGGHLVFFTVEAITRRPVSMKVREVAQQVGILLLLALMFFVFYNDIMRLLNG